MSSLVPSCYQPVRGLKIERLTLYRDARIFVAAGAVCTAPLAYLGGRLVAPLVQECIGYDDVDEFLEWYRQNGARQRRTPEIQAISRDANETGASSNRVEFDGSCALARRDPEPGSDRQHAPMKPHRSDGQSWDRTVFVVRDSLVG